MAGFDVFRKPDGVGWLFDVQADLLGHLNMRVLVPLLPPGMVPIAEKPLSPVFEVGGEAVVMATRFLAAVPALSLIHI